MRDAAYATGWPHRLAKIADPYRLRVDAECSHSFTGTPARRAELKLPAGNRAGDIRLLCWEKVWDEV